MRIATPLLILALTAGIAGGAQAKGCLAGAAVGGVAGHMAGHHAGMGAAAGCVVGHHHAKMKAKRAQQQPSGH